jgi:hypothetical protein
MNRNAYFEIVGVYMFAFGIIGAPVLWFFVGLIAGDWSFPLWFVSSMFGLGFVLGNLSYLFNERWS